MKEDNMARAQAQVQYLYIYDSLETLEHNKEILYTLLIKANVLIPYSHSTSRCLSTFVILPKTKKKTKKNQQKWVIFLHLPASQ